MNDISIIEVNSGNILEKGMCCSKNKKSGGYIAKSEWAGNECNKNLKLLIAKDSNNKYLGFIEFTDRRMPGDRLKQ